MGTSTSLARQNSRFINLFVPFISWVLLLSIVCTFTTISAESCDLYTWGDGTKSKLGHGEETEEQKPRIVDALSRLNIRLVACGAKYMLCVTGRHYNNLLITHLQPLSCGVENQSLF